MDNEKIQEELANNSQNENTQETNIFSELSGELDFWAKKEEVVEIKKDKLYYLKMTWKYMFYSNIWFVVILFMLYLFVSIQNNKDLYNKPFLDPFCFVILSDEEKNTWDYCSSVSSLLQDYELKNKSLTEKISTKLSSMIWDVYAIENFVNSKEVSFLIDNKTNRLLVLNMLNDFDNMKNDFTGFDKWKIDCKNLKISNDYTLDVECNLNSSSWEMSNSAWEWIVWFSWDRKEWTIDGSSITLAASFLNFIERNPTYNFQLLEKQKDFKSDFVVWEETSYVKKTTIKFKLKYNNIKNNLSL